MILFNKNKKLSKEYLRFSVQDFHLTVFKKSAENEFLKLCCKDPANDIVFFRNIPSSDHTRVYFFEYMGRQYYYKAFLQRNRLEFIKNLIKGSRAKRALRGFLHLHANGFHTPRVVVAGEKKQLNFIISEAIINPGSLQDYFPKQQRRLLSREKIAIKRKIIAELGHVIGKMHALGIFHGDLRWGNILVDNLGSKRIRFVFIDNERTKHFSWSSNRYRLKNLVQLNMVQTGLNVSNADRMRFFKSYLAHNQNLIPQRKKWIRRILEKTAWRFARKNIRR